MTRNIMVTVDAVVVDNNKVLMVKRKKEPFKGKFVLPGGHVDYNEVTRDAITREVKEETGYDVRPIATLGVYDDPNRDPRGHYLSIVYICSLQGGEKKANKEETEKVEWKELKDIDKVDIGFDHKKMILSYLGIMSLGKRK